MHTMVANSKLEHESPYGSEEEGKRQEAFSQDAAHLLASAASSDFGQWRRLLF